MPEIRKYIARYGAMRLLGIFTFPSEDPLFHGTKVILRTSRGQEAGTILCEATEEAINSLPPGMEENRVIRLMTSTDETEVRQIRIAEKDEFNRTKAIIERMKIVMDLVRVEHIFGGERLIVYYVAEGRIDFRELVKVLASEFQTRIEMRQIGVRDETKLLADVGDCGREVCCNSYLISMPPVSMKMAKLQKATLDPTKISGRCGRLKCCLRYEYDVYAELLTIVPPIGKWVETPDGPGRVLSQELLAKTVLVELNDRTRKSFPADKVTVIAGGYSGPPAQEDRGEDYPKSRDFRPPREFRDSKPPKDPPPREERDREKEPGENSPINQGEDPREFSEGNENRNGRNGSGKRPDKNRRGGRPDRKDRPNHPNHQAPPHSSPPAKNQGASPSDGGVGPAPSPPSGS